MMLPGEDADVPRFVLMHERRRVGPQLMTEPAGVEYAAVYGFSTRALYERFRGNSDLALAPYPLVQAYLRAEGEKSNAARSLIVIDAAGPGDARLYAATTGAVLEAQEHQATRVAAAYQLVRGSGSQAYQVAASKRAGAE